MTECTETFTLNDELCAVPDWFASKKLTQNESFAVHNGADGWEVIRETAKAIRLANETDYGTVYLWVPKSIVIHEAQLVEAMEAERERRESMDAYYAYLRQLAKDNGVKLGSIRKWAKIQAKLTEAGVEWQSYRDFAA